MNSRNPTQVAALLLPPLPLWERVGVRGGLCFVFPLLLLFAAASTRADDNFGYLFTTPAQRAVLDRLPVHGTVTGEEPEALGADTPDTGRAPIKVDGVVSSSSGKTNAWINGAKPQDNKKFKTGAIKTGKVDVIVGPDDTRITLKPGQSYEPDSGKVRDNYQSGTPDPGAGKCRSSKADDGEINIVCD